jgi:alkanesulfonate monooxygenase SsuD/methylene tetrahydromethanopterin reductase-like flavin-dependent oxidoreductase (luciferase family)
VTKFPERISIHLTGQTADELIAGALEAERAGVQSIWASELYGNPFVPLAAVASSTSRLKLGTGIALAFVRSPLALALEAFDMDALTNGRFILGLGSGVRRLNESWHGVTNFGGPVKHMREVVEFIRLFEANAHLGTPIELAGEFVDVSIKGYKRPFAPKCARLPIYLGANRPGMLRLAGEVADGVLGHVFLSPRHLRDEFLPPIHEGLRRAGRERGAIDVGAGIVCAIDDDVATARRHAAGVLAFYATVKTYEPIFAGDGFLEECGRIRAAFHSGARERAIDEVTDAMVDTYCAAGTADDVRRRVGEYEGLLDTLGLTPPRHFCPPDAWASYRTKMLEVFGR